MSFLLDCYHANSILWSLTLARVFLCIEGLCTLHKQCWDERLPDSTRKGIGFVILSDKWWEYIEDLVIEAHSWINPLSVHLNYFQFPAPNASFREWSCTCHSRICYSFSIMLFRSLLVIDTLPEQLKPFQNFQALFRINSPNSGYINELQ